MSRYPTSPTGPDLTALSPAGFARWLEAYEAGCTDGWTRGYDAAVQDMAALHRQTHAMVQQLAKVDPYDVLCDKRGEHDRAERQRTILRERGIA